MITRYCQLVCLLGSVSVATGTATYQLINQREFGVGQPITQSTANTPLTAVTNAQFPVSYNNVDIYNGNSTVNGALVFGASSYLDLNQTTSIINVGGYIVRNTVSMLDPLTILGGSGTAYVSPIWQIDATFVDNSSDVSARLDACFGVNSVCNPFFVPGALSTGGTQNLSFVFSPGPLFSAQATFGVQTTSFMFVRTVMVTSTTGPQTLAAGPPISADATFRLLGYRVIDASGNVIPGASVVSDATSLVPEPGSMALWLSGLASFGFLRRRSLYRAGR